MEHLTNSGRAVVDAGLKYVHNDTCYPALLVIGQFIDALDSGKYDTNRVALMLTQTGGGCRASNYIHLLRKALRKAGYGHVPVISLNAAGMEKNSGFKLTLGMIPKAIGAISYGDLLMLLKNQVKPYEKRHGESAELADKWIDKLCDDFAHGRGMTNMGIRKNVRKIIKSFSEIPMEKRNAIKVGVVGEIFVKYSPLANNDLEEFLFSQGCEVMIPGLMGFLLYCIEDTRQDYNLYGGSVIELKAYDLAKKYILSIEKIIIDEIRSEGSFTPPMEHDRVRELSKSVIGFGCKMGEGWFLTAEMLELAEHGYENIICAQPFGCLPNHISGKGMVRKIREVAPRANIVCVDYDPGATRVNQENRIKLMLSMVSQSA